MLVALYTACLVLFVCGLWELLLQLHVVNPFLMPSLLEIASVLPDLILCQAFWYDVLCTIWRMSAAFLVSLSGVGIGIAVGAHKQIYAATIPVIDFLRSIPSTAIFPLFLVLFGIGDLSKILVTGCTGSLILVFYTAYGIQQVSIQKTRTISMFHASVLQKIRWLFFWEVLPYVFSATRIVLSLSLVIIVVTEMFGATSGIGHLLINFQTTYQLPSLYATIFLLGCIGYGLNVLLSTLEKRVIHWQ